MFAALAGLVAGLSHVISGPDHLAALAPLAVRDRRGAWRSGISWAIGHAGGVGIIALVALALRDALPVSADWLSGWSERLVGVVLIGIGAWGIHRALSGRLHTHVHEHGGHRHVHLHLHQRHAGHEPEEGKPHQHTHAAMAVGTLHGLAGGTHLLGVVPALALAPPKAIAYLAAYGVGTVVAMAGFALMLGILSERAGQIGTGWARGLMTLSGVAAIAVGGYWLYIGGSGAI